MTNRHPKFADHDFGDAEYAIRSMVPHLFGDLGKTQHSGPMLQVGRDAAKATEFMIALTNERGIDGRCHAFGARDPHGRLVEAARAAADMGWIELAGYYKHTGQEAYVLTESGLDFSLRISNALIAAQLAFQRVLGTLVADAVSGKPYQNPDGVRRDWLPSISGYHTCWQHGVERVSVDDLRETTIRMLGPPAWVHKPVKIPEWE